MENLIKTEIRHDRMIKREEEQKNRTKSMIQVRLGSTGTQPISEGQQSINNSTTYQSYLDFLVLVETVKSLIGVIENQVFCHCH